MTLQVELRAWLGADYVQGSLCGKMPDLMRKDVEKLIADFQGSKTQPERCSLENHSLTLISFQDPILQIYFDIHAHKNTKRFSCFCGRKLGYQRVLRSKLA